MNSSNQNTATPIVNHARGMRKMSSEWYEAQEDFAAKCVKRIEQTHNVSEQTALGIFKHVSKY